MVTCAPRRLCSRATLAILAAMHYPAPGLSLDLATLQGGYAAGTLRPSAVADVVAARVAAADPAIWIHRTPPDDLRAQAAALEARARDGQPMPLYGVPFAVKDNIDVAGVPTTAACPGLSRTPAMSATVVARLLAAGAMLVGKTNLDQLATGLTGVRSPYGVPRNPFRAGAIPGGSSSGSAVAVAVGACAFALGTDTAGSGRVPAAFNNVVGLKPSRGLLSARGVLPASRSLDCVSVFALTCEDAGVVAEVAAGFDPEDPFARPEADGARFRPGAAPPAFAFGVPDAREFFGDGDAERLFDEACARLAGLGGTATTVPFAPLREAAALLYEGAWLAERLAAWEEPLRADPSRFLPVVAEILASGARHHATDAFRAMHRLAELAQQLRPLWTRVAAVVVPTTPTVYDVDAVRADPIRLNARLGVYTNFVNLLDLAAWAVPAGFRPDGVPAGVTLIGPRGSEPRVGAIAAALHRAAGLPAGATGRPLPALPPPPPVAADEIAVAVVGAHLSGQPLNHQLTGLSARLVRACHTAPRYRLFALPGTTPPKPGLVRVAHGGRANRRRGLGAAPRGLRRVLRQRRAPAGHRPRRDRRRRVRSRVPVRGARHRRRARHLGVRGLARVPGRGRAPRPVSPRYSPPAATGTTSASGVASSWCAGAAVVARAYRAHANSVPATIA